MNKSELLNELSSRLRGIPQSEAEKTINYYSEMIDDRIEDGESEEEAVEAIGDIDEIVRNAMSQVPLTGLVKQSVKRNFNFTVPVIILLILGFPIWGSLVIALLSIVFAVYVSIAAVIISLFAIVAALVVSGVVSVIASPFLISVSLYSAATLFAGGLIIIGLSIFAFYAAFIITRYIIRFTKFVILKIKSLFIKKERA